MTPFGIRKKLKKLLGLEKAPPAPAAQVPRYTVAFEVYDGTNYTVKAKHQDTLVMASGRGPVPIATGCADNTCGTCRVEVLAGGDLLTPETETERKLKADNGIDAALRLGCQVAILGEGVKVKIPDVWAEVN